MDIENGGAVIAVRLGKTDLDLATFSTVRGLLTTSYIPIPKEALLTDDVSVYIKNVLSRTPSSVSFLAEYRNRRKLVGGVLVAPSWRTSFFFPAEHSRKPRPGDEFEIIVYSVRLSNKLGHPLMYKRAIAETLGLNYTKKGQFTHFVQRKTNFNWEYVGGPPHVFRFQYVTSADSLLPPSLPSYPEPAVELSNMLVTPMFEVQHKVGVVFAEVRKSIGDEHIREVMVDVWGCIWESLQVLQAYACTPWPSVPVLQEYIKEKRTYVDDLLCELLEVMHRKRSMTRKDMNCVRTIRSGLSDGMDYLNTTVAQAQSATLLDTMSAEGNVFS
ncbi:hypothetical protein K474DRAFT_1384143 [Panus rudis PR-1116 ss-1]|nr:hypothetical protein K474DRAFT_1384143 [Panus rudis PR-1116 ss-1]